MDNLMRRKSMNELVPQKTTDRQIIHIPGVAFAAWLIIGIVSIVAGLILYNLHLPLLWVGLTISAIDLIRSLYEPPWAGGVLGGSRH
jgi:hypothetical protein